MTTYRELFGEYPNRELLGKIYIENLQDQLRVQKSNMPAAILAGAAVLASIWVPESKNFSVFLVVGLTLSALYWCHVDKKALEEKIKKQSAYLEINLDTDHLEPIS